MKFRKPIHFRSSLLTLSFAMTLGTQAASNTWVGTTNVWDTGTTANWTSPTTWTSGDDAVFGAPGTGGLALSLNTVSAHNIDFNTSGYGISGSTLTFTGAAPTITAATGISATISSTIAGTAGLTKAGMGDLLLTGPTSYSGNTAINQGPLTYKAPSNAAWTIGGGTKTIATGATMKVDFSTQTTQFLSTSLGTTVINGTLNLSGTAANANGFYVVSGLAASGVGSINIIGGGSVIINSAAALNSFTGAININGSNQLTLQGSTTSATGTYALNIAAGGTFDVRTDSHTIGALSGSGPVIKSFNGFGGTLTIGNGGGDGNYSGTMTDQATVYNVVKTGAGTQILSAANSSYSGTTTISGGVLNVTTLANGGSTSSIGDSSNAAANLVINGGTLRYTGTTASTNRNFTLGTSGATLDASGSGALTLTGAPTLSGSNNARTFTLSGTNTNDNTLQGAIPNNGTGATTLVKNGTGKWVLSAANHGYTGSTVISGGTLTITGSIPASPIIDLQASGTLAIPAISTGQTLTGTGTLAGNTTVQSGATLSPAGAGTIGTLTATGALTLAGNSSFDIQKTGSTLSSDSVTGAASVVLGGTLTVTATGDTLALGDTFTLLSTTGGFSGTFASFVLPTLPSGLFWNTTTLATDGTIRVEATPIASIPFFSPLAGNYVGAQSVTITSDAGSTIHYTMDGSDPTTSGTVLTASSPASGIVVPTNSNVTINAYATKSGNTDSPVSTATYHTVTTPTWSVDTNGAWSDSSNWLNTVIPDATGVSVDFYSTPQSADTLVTVDGNRTVGNMTFGNSNAINWTLGSSGSNTLTLATTSGSPTITVNNNAATVLASLAGSQGLVKVGAGELILAGSVGYTGNTAINEGTLTFKMPGNLAWTLNGGTKTIASGATMKIDLSPQTTQYLETAIGATVISATGALELHGTNANSADWYVIQTNGWTPTGSGTVNVTGGGSIALKVEDFTGFTGTVDIQNGMLSNNSPNASASNTFNIHIASVGKLDIRTDGLTINALNGSGMVIKSYNGFPGTLTIGNGNGSGNFSGAMTGQATSYNLVKTGTGTQILSGALSYPGTTTINGGTLVINGTSTGSAFTVASTGTLAGTGGIGGSVTVNSGGSIAPGGSGIGILAVGAATLNGTYVCQIDGASADSVAVTGNLTLGAGATIAFSPVNPATASSYTIATYTGTLAGTPTITGLPSGYVVDTSTTGQIRLVQATGYSTWAATFTALTDTNPQSDPDHDGIANILEFVTNGDPTVDSGANLPTVSADGASLVFTFIERDDAAYLNPTVEFSTSLASGSWTTAVNGSNSTIGSVDNGNGTHTITVTIPKGSQATLFARLKVTIP